MTVVIVAATTLAMTPRDADARYGYRGAWRAPARVSVGYGPRYVAPRVYAPRSYSNRLYYSAPRRSYYGGRGVGVAVGPRLGGYYYGW